MRAAERIAMCVLTPACVLGGLLRCALASLASAGFEIVRASLIRFRPEHVEGIWRAQLESFGADRVRVMTDHLVSGPSLVLLLRSDPGSPGVSGQSRLKSFKGPSDPRFSKPGHLRARLGALNKMINFVHSPDDTNSLFREASILFGADWLPDALDEGGMAQDGGRCAISGLQRRFAVPSVALSIPRIAILARKRLVDRLGAMPNDMPSASLRHLQRLTEAELSWINRCPGGAGWTALRSFRERHSCLEPAHAELSCELRRLAECRDTAPSPAEYGMYAAIDDILFGRRTSIAPLYSVSTPFACLDRWETTLLASQALSEAA